MTATHDSRQLEQRILDLVGALRAESLGDQVFEFFAEPAFFPQLQSVNSVVLKGGRGTGKTTLLRCLSYQGQSVLREASGHGIEAWPFFGLFWRININRVAAFSGPELSQERWVKLFGHYVNLELTELLLEFVEWAGRRHLNVNLGATAFEEVALSLNLRACNSLTDLRQCLRHSRLQFEARLNNIADSDSHLGLSLLAAPVDLLVYHLRRVDVLAGKKLFFLIDEYENLLDYQQEVFNTLIKHSSSGYAFKIGVKEMGFRRRTTIGGTEALSSPADYTVIDITSALATRFDSFAARLVASRLERVAKQHNQPVPTVRSMFETLTPDEEALRLGVAEVNANFREALSAAGESRLASEVALLSPLEQYFVSTWSKASKMPVTKVVKGLSHRERVWTRRYGNYAFALLFSIRAGKPGRHKLYAGWHSICRLANSNVRYLLELVAGMLQRHVADGHDFGEKVSAELQTDQAYEVGRKNLQELERDSDQAASLVKLVLGLGRVFEVLASSPVGHTPEVTQFSLPSSVDTGMGPGDIERRVKELLDEAVNALAVVRFPGSKLQNASSVRAYDYALHPMFTALFGFSYRRKRKIEISEEEMLAFVSEPRWAIRRILLRQNRDPSLVPIPDQLRLFSSFYASNT